MSALFEELQKKYANNHVLIDENVEVIGEISSSWIYFPNSEVSHIDISLASFKTILIDDSFYSNVVEDCRAYFCSKTAARVSDKSLSMKSYNLRHVNGAKIQFSKSVVSKILKGRDIYPDIRSNDVWDNWKSFALTSDLALTRQISDGPPKRPITVPAFDIFYRGFRIGECLKDFRNLKLVNDIYAEYIRNIARLY